MDTGIDMVAPPPAGEEALQENDQGFEEQDLDQGFGQHFLITDTSGSLLPLKNTSNSSSSTPKVVYLAYCLPEQSNIIWAIK